MKAWVLSIGLALSLQIAPIETGSISGVVIESNTSSPIPDVAIEIYALHMQDRRDAKPSSPPFKTIYTTTDDRGRFEVRGLPPGRYQIQCQRAGFYTTEKPTGDEGLGIGISTSGRPPLNVWTGKSPSRYEGSLKTEVSLETKQPTKELTLSLLSGGVVSGRVLDAGGQPLAGGKITALGLDYEQGFPFLYEVDSVAADERGNFRLWGMAPGSYYIRADYRNSQDQLHFSYFPGVPSAAEAASITVASGAEYRGANFNIQPGVSKIRGTAAITPASLAGPTKFYPDGKPRPSDVRYFLTPLDSRAAVDPLVVAATQGYGERFELRGVRPGNYVLYAVLHPEPSSDSDETANYVGRTTVSVGSQDLENISISIAAQDEIHGRVVAVDGARLENEKLAIRWRLKAGVFPEEEALQSWTTPDTDGTFSLHILSGVRYDLTVSELPPGTAVVEIRQGGTSAFDDGISGDRGSMPVEVVISGAAGKVAANVVDAKQQAVTNAVVALVPAKEHQMNPNLYHRAKFDEASGQYFIEGIAPGEYTLFAWDSIPNDAEYNAAFMREFEERGIRVTIRAKETTNVSLPLIVAGNAAGRD